MSSDNSNLLPDADSDDEKEGSDKGKGKDKLYDKTSLNSVLGHLPMFTDVKSMLQEIVDARGHLVELSSTYHAEVAGQGIEYSFGRNKWWYKKHKRGKTASLKEMSRTAFDKCVVGVDHVRKFARKARDYMHIYRECVKGLAAEDIVKKCKTHRSMVDSFNTFVTE